MYKAVSANMWDMHVPVKNESGKNGLPRDDANKFKEGKIIILSLNFSSHNQNLKDTCTVYKMLGIFGH